MATLFVRLIVLLIVVAAGVFYFVVPGVVDRSMNKVVEVSTVTVKVVSHTKIILRYPDDSHIILGY